MPTFNGWPHPQLHATIRTRAGVSKSFAGPSLPAPSTRMSWPGCPPPVQPAAARQPCGHPSPPRKARPRGWLAALSPPPTLLHLVFPVWIRAPTHRPCEARNKIPARPRRPLGHDPPPHCASLLTLLKKAVLRCDHLPGWAGGG
jgi:hypothetical protein